LTPTNDSKPKLIPKYAAMILSGVQTSLFESLISHSYDTKYRKRFPKKVSGR